MHVHSYEHGVDVVASVFLVFFTIVIQIAVYTVLYKTKSTFEKFFPAPTKPTSGNQGKDKRSLTVFEERSRGYSRVPGTFDTSAFR
jgi:hypothetical protein